MIRQYHDVVEAHDAVRIVIEKARLELKLVRIRPVVIPFEKGQVPAATRLNATDEIPIHADVVREEERANSLSVIPLVGTDDVARPVGRAVFSDDNLGVEVYLLREDPVERLRKKLLVVVRRQNDRDLHSRPRAGSSLAEDILRPARRMTSSPF